MAELPGALAEEMPVESPEPVPAPSGRTRSNRLGDLSRQQIGWGVTAAVFIVWCIWAFVEDGTAFVALAGAGLAQGSVVALAAIGFLVIEKATGHRELRAG